MGERRIPIKDPVCYDLNLCMYMSLKKYLSCDGGVAEAKAALGYRDLMKGVFVDASGRRRWHAERIGGEESGHARIFAPGDAWRAQGGGGEDPVDRYLTGGIRCVPVGRGSRASALRSGRTSVEQPVEGASKEPCFV